MRLIHMGDNHICTVASFAMALEIPLDVMITDLGHDGMVVHWPDLGVPNSFCGVHPQELIEVARRRRYAVTEIQLNPVSENSRGDLLSIKFDPSNEARFLAHVHSNRGVLAGLNQRTNLVHFCAWDGYMVFDPRGIIYPLYGLVMAGYQLFSFYIFDKIP